MRTASWILLLLVGGLIAFGSLASTGFMYGSGWGQDQIGSMQLDKLAEEYPDVAIALRARRGTAAAYAAAYATLLIWIVVGPYRRGERWSWWALLGGTLVFVVITALRIPLLGTQLGVGVAWIMLAAVAVALLLDVKRLKAAG